jgi:hypothetical protein
LFLLETELKAIFQMEKNPTKAVAREMVAVMAWLDRTSDFGVTARGI